MRRKLIISFVIIVLIIGAITTTLGVYLIDEDVIKQAQDKIRTDLNSAREIYQNEVNKVGIIVRLTAERFYIKDSLINHNLTRLNSELDAVRQRESLDVLTLTDPTGKVLVRSRNPQVVGDDQSSCPLIKKALTEKEAFASTELISREELARSAPELAEQARIPITDTPRAKPTQRKEETNGMMLKAAAPVVDYNGNLLGVLYGGNLVNRNYRLVDKIKDTVFQNERYQGKDIGTATIFLGDVRISTNVKTTSGERAIGTRIAADVGDRVLVKGEPWIERAFVVQGWYFTAYEPIRNISNQIIGVLYVGMQEDKFVDLKRETLGIFLSIIIIGLIIALVIGYLVANSITKPVRQLANAAQQLAKGDFNQQVAVNTRDEIGELSKTFNFMVGAIRERDEKLKAETQQALIQMEKMSSLGQMAAGVAHEINNPLSGVLTYLQLILKNIRAGKPLDLADLEKKLATMERETERCTRIIKSLLDFSRQTQPSIRPIDLVKVIENSLVMLAHQAELSNIVIVKKYQSRFGGLRPEGLSPEGTIEADPDQLQQVFTNMILNAFQAMAKDGTLTISTVYNMEKKMVGVVFRDTGPGITPENLKKLFTPFFTTKEKGQGIGLGLAVCYGIIQRHGGDIKVESELGKGTTFTIWLKEKQSVT